MTEKDLEQLRSQDTALRKAVGRRASIVPPMSNNLNDQILLTATKPRRKKVVVWPWVIAACIAAILVIFLAPPQRTSKVSVGKKQIAKIQKKTVTEEASPTQQLVAETTPPKTVSMSKPKTEIKVEETITEPEPEAEQIPATEVIQPEPQPEQPQVARIVREQDLPITNPENLRYTAEEIALLKQQAREAYIKWVKLEMEINRQNLDQTAEYIKQMK